MYEIELQTQYYFYSTTEHLFLYMECLCQNESMCFLHEKFLFLYF